MFPDARPLWPMQVSIVINLHRSKLPPIPNEGSAWGCRRKKERTKEENKEEKEVDEVTLAGNSEGASRRTEQRIDEDSDGR